MVLISEARARLTELAEDVVAGREKLLTKNGAGYVALVDARRLGHYHQLDAEYGSMLLANAAVEGLEAVGRGEVLTAEQADALLREEGEPAAER